MANVYKLAMIVHIYSAIVLVGSMFFNAFILGPALKRIPPAQAATVGDKIGAGLRVAGPASLVPGASGRIAVGSVWLRRPRASRMSAMTTLAPSATIARDSAGAWT